MFKICVIGCGWVADFGHGPAYHKYASENSDVELTACCDIDKNRSQIFRVKYGFKKDYTDYLKMLKNESPDAVCLNVPPALTASIGAEILKGGYPIMIEKPSGAKLEQTLMLLEVAEKCGTPNMVAFNRRFMPLIQTYKKTMKRYIDLQEIQNIEYKFLRYNRKEPNFEITAIHGIDLVQYLSDSEFQSIDFYYQNIPDYGENVMNIYLQAELKSGASAVLHYCPMSGGIVERINVNALNFSFFINIPVWDSIDITGNITSVEKNELVSELSLNDNRKNVDDFLKYGFYGEDIAFFDFIRSGTKPSPGIKESIQTAEIMECIRTKQSKYQCK